MNPADFPVKVDPARCTGCGRCVAVCPGHLLTLHVAGYRKHAFLIAPAQCTICLRCVAECPVGAASSRECCE